MGTSAAEQTPGVITPLLPLPTYRPMVTRFAAAMEERMAEHDAEKGPEGWKPASPERLVRRAAYKLSEVQATLDGLLHLVRLLVNAEREDEETVQMAMQELLLAAPEFVKNAADAGNFLAMAVDRVEAVASQVVVVPAEPASVEGR